MSIETFKSIFEMAAGSTDANKPLYLYCMIDRFTDKGPQTDQLPLSGAEYKEGVLCLYVDDPKQIDHPVEKRQMQRLLLSLNLMPEQMRLLNAAFIDLRFKKHKNYKISADRNTLTENDQMFQLLFWTEPQADFLADA